MILVQSYNRNINQNRASEEVTFTCDEPGALLVAQMFLDVAGVLSAAGAADLVSGSVPADVDIKYERDVTPMSEQGRVLGHMVTGRRITVTVKIDDVAVYRLPPHWIKNLFQQGESAALDALYANLIVQYLETGTTKPPEALQNAINRALGREVEIKVREKANPIIEKDLLTPEQKVSELTKFYSDKGLSEMRSAHLMGEFPKDPMLEGKADVRLKPGQPLKVVAHGLKLMVPEEYDELVWIKHNEATGEHIITPKVNRDVRVLVVVRKGRDVVRVLRVDLGKGTKTELRSATTTPAEIVIQKKPDPAPKVDWFKSQKNDASSGQAIAARQQATAAKLDATGKIPNVSLPPIQQAKQFTAQTIEQMQALRADTGDICFVTDEATAYILDGRNKAWVKIDSGMFDPNNPRVKLNVTVEKKPAKTVSEVIKDTLASVAEYDDNPFEKPKQYTDAVAAVKQIYDHTEWDIERFLENMDDPECVSGLKRCLAEAEAVQQVMETRAKALTELIAKARTQGVAALK